MLARIIKEKPIWTKKPSWWYKVWSYILMEVNHRDNSRFKRGTNFFSTRGIYNDCCLYNEGIRSSAVGNFLKFAKTQSLITTQKTTRGFILTVCNYDFYQNLDNYRNLTENRTENQKGTGKELERNRTINNNVNNVKNKKNKINITATEIRNWFDKFWEQYPRKLYKKATVPVFFEKIRDDNDWDKLQIALTNYNKSKDVEDGTIMNAYNWLDSYEDWVDYREPKKKSSKLKAEDL